MSIIDSDPLSKLSNAKAQQGEYLHSKKGLNRNSTVQIPQQIFG